MSNTPETDKQCEHYLLCHTTGELENFPRKFVPTDFARKLEIQLGVYKAVAEDRRREFLKVLDERDEARRLAEDWREDARIACGVLHGSAQATEKLPWEKE